MSTVTLALDAMGGDHGPAVVVAALKRALQSFPDLQIQLVGDEQELKPLLAEADLASDPRCTLVHASQVVNPHDRPAHCLRSKQDSSMSRAIDLVAADVAQACVSAGNTGALMAMSYMKLKTLPGVMRPALVAQLPNQQGGQTYLLDLGANPMCDSESLFQFGVMGSVMAADVSGIPEPRVALLNMGEEDIKGNDTVKRAGQLLQDSAALNYVGFLEGNDLFAGRADVVVCDGFTGNIALKSCEGMAQMVYDHARRSLQGHWFSRILAGWLVKRLRKEWQWLNPDQYNGATLLGLRGVVMKSHGNASETAFYNAISQAVAEARLDLPSRIHDRVEQVLTHSE